MTIRKINILLFVVFVLLLTGCKSNTPSITGSDYIEVTIGTQLPDLLENITITNAELSDITIDSSSVDVNTLGEYIVTFSVNNGSKDPIIFEQTVRVVAYPISDIPMIFGVKDLTYIIGEDIPDYFDGLTAVDREYGNLTSKITGDFSNVKLDTPGQYLITYYVENIAGYQGSSTAYITVVLDDFEMNLPDEFIIVSQNGLFGIMTSSENILLPIEYDAISYVGDGMIQLIKNESEYYFDSESNEFYQYDYDLQSNFNDGLALVLNESSFYSYIHKDGTVAFPFVYSDASIFVDGKAIVSIGSSYGVIDTSGNEVIDLMYDDITLVFDNCFAKKVGDQYLVVDNEDDFIIELSSDEYSELWLENGDVLYVVEIDHTAALLDENFNVLIQSNHDQLIQYDDDNYIGIGTASYSIYNLKTDTQIDALGDYYTSKFEIYNTGTGYGRYDYELGYSVIPPIYQYLAVSPLNPNHYLAKNDVDMFGIITADNQIVYHFDAQHLTTSTSSGLYTFYDKDMYAGLLDADGKMVTATTYSAIGGFINGYAIVIDKVTGLYGYIDEKGTEVLSPRYYIATSFSEGFARVKTVDTAIGWSVIDTDFNIITTKLYFMIHGFNSGMAIVQTDNCATCKGYINDQGVEIITPTLSIAGSFINGYATVEFKTGDNTYGVINQNGDIIVPGIYAACQSESEGLIRVLDEHGLYGYYNTSGELVITPQFVSAFDFKDGRAIVSNSEGKFGIIDMEGDFILNYQPLHISDFSEGLSAIYDSNIMRWGYINNEGELEIPYLYTSVYAFYNGFAVVKSAETNLWGIIDQEGNTFIDFDYAYIRSFYPPAPFSFIRYTMNEVNIYKMIDLKGNIVFDELKGFTGYQDHFGFNLETKYDNIWVMYEDGVLSYDVYDDRGNVYTLMYDGEWSLYQDGIEVLTEGYDDIYFSVEKGMWEVTRDGKTGLLDRKFDVVLEPIFDSISIRDNQAYYFVSVNGSNGVYDMEGNEIISPIYESILLDQDLQLFIVSNGEIYGLYDALGNEILPLEFNLITYISMLNNN